MATICVAPVSEPSVAGTGSRLFGVCYSRRVEVRLLGEIEAIQGGSRPVAIRGKKLQALLGYLAVRARPQPRAALAAMLWGDMPQERARHNLRQTLAKIRRELGEVLLTEADLVQLDPSTCQTDVAEFLSLAGQTEQAELERAIALYRGDLLHGLRTREQPFEDWLGPAREDLRQRMCNVTDRAAQIAQTSGDPDAAIAFLRRRLSIDPASERTHLRLIELFIEVGKRSEALRQYTNCVEALARHLQVEPAAEIADAYQRARAMDERAAALPARVDVAPELPSIAVLPFVNQSEGDDDRYFSEGIAEDITAALSHFGSLLVVASAASFHYRDTNQALPEIGAKLGARYLLQGRVRRAGERVRIACELVDTDDQSHVWAHRYDRELSDVFAVQDEVSETIVATLVGRLEAARARHARSKAPSKLSAYDLVLRGRELHHRHTKADCEAAIQAFEQAIERDPDYAQAHSWLACGLGQSLEFGNEDPAAAVARADALTQRALRLDPEESETHRIIARIRMLQRAAGDGIAHAQRALVLNPNCERIAAAMGEVLLYAGRHDEAEIWLRRSMRLNPFHPEHIAADLAHSLFHLERYAESSQGFGALTRPRIAHQVLHLAASVRAGEQVGERVARFLDKHPNCDPAAVADSMPFTQTADKQRVRDALSEALSVGSEGSRQTTP